MGNVKSLQNLHTANCKHIQISDTQMVAEQSISYRKNLNIRRNLQICDDVSNTYTSTCIHTK